MQFLRRFMISTTTHWSIPWYSLGIIFDIDLRDIFNPKVLTRTSWMSYDPGDYHALIRKTLKKKKKGRREQVIKKKY